jgi:hypothetical protein
LEFWLAVLEIQAANEELSKVGVRKIELYLHWRGTCPFIGPSKAVATVTALLQCCFTARGQLASCKQQAKTNLNPYS